MRQIVERAPVPAIRKGFGSGGMGIVRRRPAMVTESEAAPEVSSRRLAGDGAAVALRRDHAPAVEELRAGGRRLYGRVPLPYSLFERKGEGERGGSSGEVERHGGERVEVGERRRAEALRAGNEAGREVLRSRAPWGRGGYLRATAPSPEVGWAGRREVERARMRDREPGRWEEERVVEWLAGERRSGSGAVTGVSDGLKTRRRGGFSLEEELRLELVR